MKKIIFALTLLFPTTGFAATTYQLLAPLGPLSGSVTLGQYLTGIMQVVIGVAGILAVVMIVICGIQMIGSPSVSQKSASKDCITSAIFGLLLAISSWIILNTINTQLLASDLSLLNLPAVPVPAAPSTANAPMPTRPGFYFRYQDSTGGPILNSPQWATADACLAGKDAKVAMGGTVVQTPAGSNIQCFQIFAPPAGTPPPPAGSPPIPPPAGEANARIAICGNNSCIGATPVAIKQGPCPATALNCVRAGYINVAGLPSIAISAIQALPGQKTITGGTESGHATHQPNAPIFDLRKTTALDTHVRNVATQSARSFGGWCRYRVTVGGGDWWFTDEGDHWHICQVGQPYWFCTGNDRNGATLAPGIYANCPR